MIELLILLLVLRWHFGPGLKRLQYAEIDRLALRGEAGRTGILWPGLLALVLIVAACCYVRVDLGCAYNGAHYARLAADPFAIDAVNPVACRILTPLISYLIGLRRGCMINLTNLLIAGVLVSAVYAYFRRHSSRPGDALLAAATITFSLVVLTTVHCGGYTDATTYLIVFLMWWSQRRRWLFHLLFLAGLFNHEWILFLVPWFVYLSLHDRRRKLSALVETLGGMAGSLALYLLFRDWVTSQQATMYSVDHYLGPFLQDPLGRFGSTLPYHGLGLFSVFKAMWVVPLLAAWAAWQNGDRSLVVSLALLLAGSWAQLFVAQDTSRMFTLGFMVMPLSLQYLFANDVYRFRGWAPWALLFNLLIPQLYTAGVKMEVWQPLSVHLLSYW